MPFKMKKMIVVNAPFWVSALYSIMWMFMSAKVASRMANLYCCDMHTMIGGSDALPQGTCEGTGSGYKYRYAVE